MILKGYRPEGSLYFKKGDEKEAFEVAEALMKQKYVVMLSKEEGATIVSYIQTYEAYEADRNYVAFMRYDEFEELYFEREQDEYEDEEEYEIPWVAVDKKENDWRDDLMERFIRG